MHHNENFEGTVKENITFSELAAVREESASVCRFHQFFLKKKKTLISHDAASQVKPQLRYR